MFGFIFQLMNCRSLHSFLPVPQEPHRIRDYMLHVLVLRRNWAVHLNYKFPVAVVKYFSLRLIVFEWLALCLDDTSFARTSVAMDFGCYCIVMDNLNFIRKASKMEKKFNEKEKKAKRNILKE